MKIIVYILLLLLLSSCNICLCQEGYLNYPFINEYNQKFDFFKKEATFKIRRKLIKENIYNSFTAKKLLEDTRFFLVPMYKLKWDDSLNYSDVEDFFGSLEIYKRLLFHDVAIFKEDTFIGIYICDELGSCGLSLYKDTPDSFEILLKDIDYVSSGGYDFVFYVHGILHAWWIVKGSDIKVYSLLEKRFYSPQKYLDKFYTNDKIKKITKYFDLKD